MVESHVNVECIWHELVLQVNYKSKSEENDYGIPLSIDTFATTDLIVIYKKNIRNTTGLINEDKDEIEVI